VVLTYDYRGSELDYGERWHVDQYSVDCTAPKHQMFQYAAAVAALIYPFGVPFFFFVSMYRQRSHLSGEKRVEFDNNWTQVYTTECDCTLAYLVPMHVVIPIPLVGLVCCDSPNSSTDKHWWQWYRPTAC